MASFRQSKRQSSLPVYLKGQKGFTLIELTIVLMVLTFVTAIAVVSFTSLLETKTIDHFIEQLKEDIYLTQSIALSRGKTISIHFNPNSDSYHVIGDIGEIFLDRHHSDKIKIMKGSTGYRIYFNANGNIQNPGTILIETSRGKYRLVFQLGKGRFSVKKL